MDRTCSGSGLTIGCQPKYPTEVSSTCVRAYFRGVLRIAMELSWAYRCGATGESLDRSRSWEGADPACRDQRTRRSTFAEPDPLSCDCLGSRFMLTLSSVTSSS